MLWNIDKEYRALRRAITNHELWEIQDKEEVDPRITKIFQTAYSQVYALMEQDIYKAAKAFVKAYEESRLRDTVRGE